MSGVREVQLKTLDTMVIKLGNGAERWMPEEDHRVCEDMLIQRDTMVPCQK